MVIQGKTSGNWTLSSQSAREETITFASTVAFATASATAALALDADINVRYMAATGACTLTAPTSGIDDGTELHLQSCVMVLIHHDLSTGFEARGTLAIESDTTAWIVFVYKTDQFVEFSRSVTVAS